MITLHSWGLSHSFHSDWGQCVCWVWFFYLRRQPSRRPCLIPDTKPQRSLLCLFLFSSQDSFRVEWILLLVQWAWGTPPWKRRLWAGEALGPSVGSLEQEGYFVSCWEAGHWVEFTLTATLGASRIQLPFGVALEGRDLAASWLHTGTTPCFHSGVLWPPWLVSYSPPQVSQLLSGSGF